MYVQYGAIIYLTDCAFSCSLGSLATPKTLQAAIQHFSDYENCRKFMVAVRWLDEIVRCPRCNSDKVTYLAKARLYRCYGDHPKQKFSLKVGTVFEDSPIALEKWLPAVWLIVNCKNGISSYELHRALGVTQKSAWFMLHRIRLAMAIEVLHQGRRSRLRSRSGRTLHRWQGEKYAPEQKATPDHRSLDRR